MARRTRIYYDHAVYHICIRGNNRQAVLKADEDKKSFLETLTKFKERFGFKLFGFVLMDNHAHLVVETNSLVNVSKIMQAITLSYSQKFRHRYNYTGYVWQGRFKSKPIERDSYILECIEYIHNNPVRAKMVEHPRDYRWSSYHRYNSETDPLEGIIRVNRFSF